MVNDITRVDHVMYNEWYGKLSTNYANTNGATPRCQTGLQTARGRPLI